MENLTAARRTRLHRTSAAQLLASLESSCSIEELAQINWAVLDQVPHWCFTENSARNRLQLVCGSLLLAPLMSRWIDGGLLKQARTLVGPDYFDAAMQVGSSGAVSETVNAAEPVPELLASAGAAVLVYSIDHPVIRSLLSSQFPMSVETLDTHTARSIYQLALDLIDRVQARLTSDSAQANSREALVSGHQVSTEIQSAADREQEAL